MSTQNEVSALVFGLGPESSEKYWGNMPNFSVDAIFQKLEASKKTLAETPGINVRFFYVDIDSQASLDELKSVVKQGDVERGGRPWDALCIGWGVRGQVALTEQFEDLVNYSKDTVPTAKLTFTARPDGYLETFTRHFLQLKQ